jgi:tRNA(Ile)-lysidine synthetase-like protein
VRVQRSMGRIRVSSVAPPQPGGPPAPGEAPGGLALTREGGRGRWRVGGTEVDVAWGEQRPRGYAHVASLPLEGLRFPLVLRPRLPGDRIGGAGDGGKVKKILARDRVPSFARDDVPILADGTGTVLWVVGHSDPASSFGPGPHPSPFYVALRTAAGGTES